jgi:uncharacterized protein
MTGDEAKEREDGDDAATELDEKGPLRRCIATGAVGPKDGMIRFAVAPDGQLVPDLEERLPGRGLWLSAETPALDRALAKNLFAKAARRSVTVPPDLGGRLASLLERRCLHHLGLARRAGQAVAGYEKVREALKSGHVGRGGPRPGLLVEASDASPDQRGKLTALAPDLPVVDRFLAADIAAALGREHAVHTLVAEGRIASALRRDAGRLAGLRPMLRADGDSPSGPTDNA